MSYNEKDYWSKRYLSGRSSGAGSYGEEAEFKRDFILSRLSGESISSVLDLGCGDGNLLFPILKKLAPNTYLGVDCAKPVVDQHRQKPPADFCEFVCNDISKIDRPSDVTVMMDVLFHARSNEQHAKALESFYANTIKFGFVSFWNDLASTSAKRSHCFYRPIWFDEKFDVERVVVPGFPMKEIAFIRRI
jgi:SAM-dependent methyltransferase